MTANHLSNTQTDCAATSRCASLRQNSEAIEMMIRDAVAADRRRLAAEESAQWARCFGSHAPGTRAEQIERIIRIASSRAILAAMNSGFAGSMCPDQSV